MTRHQTREIRVFALYNNSVDGRHFAVVKSGTWSQVVEYLRTVTRYAGSRALFVEGTDGALRPLMA